MDSRVVSNWCQALRSGKYRQCFGDEGKMEKDLKPSYCAIGVLGVLFEQETGLPAFRAVTADPNETSIMISHEKFPGWVGTKHWPPQDAEEYRFFDGVLCANDDMKLPFEKIAELIEQGIDPQSLSYSEGPYAEEKRDQAHV